ncbi:hypothetical protein [Marinactinospora rubrisoli]|uniref:Uncharacterized protein n=1 Tax=Marinactinospora rubrisoli TaxID=2715399 RepID=A0ABW2KCC4_9ACTN
MAIENVTSGGVCTERCSTCSGQGIDNTGDICSVCEGAGIL